MFGLDSQTSAKSNNNRQTQILSFLSVSKCFTPPLKVPIVWFLDTNALNMYTTVNMVSINPDFQAIAH